MHQVSQIGIDAAVQIAREVVADHPVYVTFDIDALDPAFAPGTGTPEFGGLTSREALDLVRGLAGLNIQGADLVEVSPPFDVGGSGAGITSLAGATLSYELMCLLCMNISRASG